MTKTNAVSFRTKASDFMECFQCLYQNNLITIDEKNDLVGSFKDCLSEEVGAKKELVTLLQNIFYREGLPMFFKQKVETLLYITNDVT